MFGFPLFWHDCRICGRGSDEGGIHEYKGKKYFVCMDCLDNAVEGKTLDELFEEKMTKEN